MKVLQDAETVLYSETNECGQVCPDFVQLLAI